MSADRIAHLARMANQICEFFEAQTPADPQAAARATAAHLKMFWAHSMRVDLIDAAEAGEDLGLAGPVQMALKEHRTELLVKGAHIQNQSKEVFPQGGGDAG